MKAISQTSNNIQYDDVSVDKLNPSEEPKEYEIIKNLRRGQHEIIGLTESKAIHSKEEGSENASGTGTPELQLSLVSSNSSGSSSSCSQEEEKAREFSSLLFMTKRLNEQTRNENYSNINKDINLEMQNALKHTMNWNKENSEKLAQFDDMSIEEWLGYIATRTQNFWYSDFLEFNENQFEWIGALKHLHQEITGRPLVTDINDNIFLSINLEKDEDRELMVTLSKIKLPELYWLKIENFYEADEDLENFVDNSLKSVRNFMFFSESYCVDFHDYLEKILKIPWIKHLHLRGFMIDSEDNERLFKSCSIEAITFVSWNLSIEDDFTIKHKEYYNDKLCFPILSKIELIDNEIDTESMEYLLNAISKSKLKDTIKVLVMRKWELKKEDVQKIINSLGLNIQVN